MRTAVVERDTKETRIRICLELDGSGKAEPDTGIGFFDHMLDGFARHGLFDLEVSVDGDLEVDCHHTVEDTGIVLGNAIREAVGDKKGIGDTEAVSCPWTRRWCFVRSTCPAGRIMCRMHSLPQNGSVIWIRRW